MNGLWPLLSVVKVFFKVVKGGHLDRPAVLIEPNVVADVFPIKLLHVYFPLLRLGMGPADKHQHDCQDRHQIPRTRSIADPETHRLSKDPSEAGNIILL